jgi:formiminoglutamase
MTGLDSPPVWTGPSGDPNDVQFGDVIEPATLEEADQYETVLVGEPYDCAVIGREGASEGPAALRRELAATKTHHFDSGSVSGIADLGDTDLPDGEGVERVQEAVREVTRAVHATDAFPVFLGGDNSLSFPNAAPLLDGGGTSVGVLSFDAHLDCREVRGEPTSGTPYRQLHEAGLEKLVVVGARHFETSGAYAEYLHGQGGELLTAEAVQRDLPGTLERALGVLEDVDTIYVSLDLDVLDGTAAPGVSAPTPGGITTRELYRMLHRVAAVESVSGFEIVECAPPLEAGDRTARAGARAIAHVLAGRGGDVA